MPRRNLSAGSPCADRPRLQVKGPDPCTCCAPSHRRSRQRLRYYLKARECHCEQRSDEAISITGGGLLRYARNDIRGSAPIHGPGRKHARSQRLCHSCEGRHGPRPTQGNDHVRVAGRDAKSCVSTRPQALGMADGPPPNFPRRQESRHRTHRGCAADTGTLHFESRLDPCLRRGDRLVP